MTVQRNGQQRQSYDGIKRLWIKDHGNVYKTKDQLYGILLSIFKNLMFFFEVYKGFLTLLRINSIDIMKNIPVN